MDTRDDKGTPAADSANATNAVGAAAEAQSGNKSENKIQSGAAAEADAKPSKFYALQPISTDGARQSHAAGDAPPRLSFLAGEYRATARRAATFVIVAAAGALVGAVAYAGLSHGDAATTASTRTLQQSVEQLTAEVAALKSGLVSAQRATSEDIGKLAHRVERAEKAQAEPAAKLAKLAESIERRLSQANTPAAPEITGSIAPSKQEARLPVAEGWRLRDYYAGRAVVESRQGALFEVGPGSNLPGLGRVETIKREDGQVVVVTRNGIITAAIEQRPLSYRSPYRY
jgi:hypothetical protein